MTPPLCHDPLGRARALAASGGRRILGLVGAPGAGKSTIAARLAEALGELALVVPMDGFHLASSELARLGRSGRKGAPDTFDAAGYIALLRRLRDPVPGEIVYAPAFRREIEEPIAGAIPVPASVRVVVTEGNYLLLGGVWAGVRPLLDEAWFVEGDDAQRRAWLLARHVAFGRTKEEAAAWIAATDEPNAALIRATQDRADWVVTPGVA